MIFGTGTESVVEEDNLCWHCALGFFLSNKFPSPLDGLEGLDTNACVSCPQLTHHGLLALAHGMAGLG